ncbi:hypothetical protein SDC9_173916 [bioreactor metagenome]|uniref:Uncharacterized protein n=1 Tax=bioreactor metagenome TaxID=1076179 RepID=A0A645GHP5_9ZZZZ
MDYTHSTIDMHNRLLRIAMQDTHDGELYHTALEAAKTFELSDTELKLYYNNGKNYLLFKKR